MTTLNREQILQANDLPRELVEVPEWGGAVWVRALTAKERLDIAKRAMDHAGDVDAFEAIDLLIIIPSLCMIDEQGQRLFNEQDVAALGEKNGDVLRRVMQKAQTLSKMDEDNNLEAQKKA